MTLPESLLSLLPAPTPVAPGLPTGLAALDAALGGGLPRGRLTEVVGASARGSGRTTLLRRIVAETLAAAGAVAYIDASRTLAPRDWAALGAHDGLWVIRPRDPARAPWCADVLLRSGAFALVVLDAGPPLPKAIAVRLTRLAREASAAFVVTRDEEPDARTAPRSPLGTAVRLSVRRTTGDGRWGAGGGTAPSVVGHRPLTGRSGHAAWHPGAGREPTPNDQERGGAPRLPPPAPAPSPSSSRKVVCIEPWRCAVQSQWRVACVRIPRFPIAAVWRSARRGDLGAREVQLLLPMRDAGRGTRDACPLYPESDGAPNPITDTTTSASGDSVRPASRVPRPASGHWDDHPIVLTDGVRRRLRAVSAAAGRSGIRAGMTIAEARAMCADVEELPWDDVAIAGAITEMTALLVEGSPQVTPVAGVPGMWWVGASGFGGRAGERALAYTLRRIAARWHPQARVAIADSCVAARAATWAGTSFQRAGDERALVCVVPPGHDADYLAPAPLVLVPMEDELRESLVALGLRTVGAFAALTAEDVERRWGEVGLAAWRLARGDDRRRPVLARVATPLAVELELPTPAATMEPVLFLVRAALDRLVAQLVADGRAAAAVAITLTLDDARGPLPDARPHTVTRELRPAHPLARVAPLFEHCRALLDQWTLSAPASGVAVTIVATTPLSGEQGNLLDTAWRDPAAADAALARLRAELGPNVVVKPVARDAFTPERAGAWADGEPQSVVRDPLSASRADGDRDGAASATRATGGRRADSGERTASRLELEPALRLLEEPQSVFVACDDDVPRLMTWQGRRITIERAVGPERLSGEWWNDGYRRDYWRCESSFGDFVLYLDRGAAQWMLQGWYD